LPFAALQSPSKAVKDRHYSCAPDQRSGANNIRFISMSSGVIINTVRKHSKSEKSSISKKTLLNRELKKPKTELIFRYQIFLLCFLQCSLTLRTKTLNMKHCYIVLCLFLLTCGVSAQTITIPPATPPRTMAEWEESQGLLIAWSYYNDNAVRAILTEIVREAREEAIVYILCTDSMVVKNHLSGQNVDISSNIEYVITTVNSIWSRDYSGNSIYTEPDGVSGHAIMDWIYNRNRPADDASPVGLANHLGVPIYRSIAAPFDLVHTGGNYMSDGMGHAFSSNLVLEENGTNNNFGITTWNQSQVEGLMFDWMGISNYTLMENLPYDEIHHIDMHMKMLDERTILVGAYPEGVADGPQIEANLQYVLDNYTDAWGQPFRIIRMPMPPAANGNYPDNNGTYRTYTNAVFVNKKILFPTYTEQYDTTATRIWQEAMPGYDVVGINSNAIITSLGAIHCITHEVGADEPLLIQHRSLDEQTGEAAFYPTQATIKHTTGIANATLYYRLRGETDYQSVVMFAGTSGTDNVWSADIPKTLTDTFVQYYIHAEAVNGKQQVRPMPAPAGYFEFHVLKESVGTQDWLGQLMQPYPNPAKAITCVPLTLNQAAQGQLRLIDVLGREVKMLHNGEFPSGDSNYFFDASTIQPGLYFVEWSAGSIRKSEAVLVR
jgi:agmatine deiminase